MKKLILFLILAVSLACEAQITKFRAEYISAKTVNSQTNEFNDWSEWFASDVLILQDENVINIYSQDEQRYDIISKSEKQISTDKTITGFDAIDEDGIRCTLELVEFSTGKYHLYIRWETLQIVYQMTKL